MCADDYAANSARLGRATVAALRLGHACPSQVDVLDPSTWRPLLASQDRRAEDHPAAAGQPRQRRAS